MKHHNDLLPDPERTELERQVEALRRDLRQLQLEHDILKKPNELLKKALGIDLSLLTAYFSPSWTSFQAERGCNFSVIVDGISN